MFNENVNDIIDYKIIDKEDDKYSKNITNNNKYEYDFNIDKSHKGKKIVEFTKLINETNKILNICCGSEHTLALSENGNVYSWGNNAYGQCGQKYEKTYY